MCLVDASSVVVFFCVFLHGLFSFFVVFLLLLCGGASDNDASPCIYTKGQGNVSSQGCLSIRIRLTLATRLRGAVVIGFTVSVRTTFGLLADACARSMSQGLCHLGWAPDFPCPSMCQSPARLVLPGVVPRKYDVDK